MAQSILPEGFGVIIRTVAEGRDDESLKNDLEGLIKTWEEIERHAILTTFEATGGSTSKAAEMLGISVRKIQYKLHEYQSAPKSHQSAVARDGGLDHDVDDDAAGERGR